jgi:hypothetical protein
VISHYVVLVLLWAAFLMMSIVAFFAIVFRRPLSAPDLRCQRRGHVLELAGRLLRLRRAGHRPLPTVHVGRRAGPVETSDG